MRRRMVIGVGMGIGMDTDMGMGGAGGGVDIDIDIDIIIVIVTVTAKATEAMTGATVENGSLASILIMRGTTVHDRLLKDGGAELGMIV
jgi:hypothetical protein